MARVKTKNIIIILRYGGNFSCKVMQVLKQFSMTWNSFAVFVIGLGEFLKLKKMVINFYHQVVAFDSNYENFKRENTITAEANVHEFKSIKTSNDSNIPGNCCCFSWCLTQVIGTEFAF